MLRVISGKYKGKRLRMVMNERVRPMPHKLKETLFNIVQLSPIYPSWMDLQGQGLLVLKP